MTHNDRQNLAQQQHQLLGAILQKSPPPPDIDLHQATTTLQNKRHHEAATCLPETQKALAENFTPLFTQFATTHPYPQTGGPLRDAANFTTWLKHTNQLPSNAALESLLLRTRTSKLPLKLAKTPRALHLALRLNSKIKILPLLRW